MVEDAWKMNVEALGEFIRTQRKLAKLSLRELAGLTDLSNAYLSQIERGLHEPSIRVVKSIATAFNLPAEALLEHAGLLDDETSPQDGGGDHTEAAIRTDPRLSENQKEALLAVYRSFSPAGGDAEAGGSRSGNAPGTTL
jgi:transcriptional regulator with XRE-family HTH domain